MHISMRRTLSVAHPEAASAAALIASADFIHRWAKKIIFFLVPLGFIVLRAQEPPPPLPDDDDARDDDGTLLKYGDMITIICFVKCGGSCDTSAPAGLIILRSEKRWDAPLFRTHAKLALWIMRKLRTIYCIRALSSPAHDVHCCTRLIAKMFVPARRSY